MKDLSSIVAKFKVQGTIEEIKPLGTGLINDTYKVNTKEDFIRRFDEITTAVKELPYCCGFCYTQVSDVQQEINGLMDMERNFKVDPKLIKEINERKVGYWRSYM